MTIGDKIKIARNTKKPKVTQEKLAELTGIARETISDIETNKMPNVSFINVEKIAKALGVPISVLNGEFETGDFQKLKNIVGTEVFLEMVKLLKREKLK